MADVITKEQIQNEIQEEVKEVVVESMKVVKRYIDEHSIDNTAKREELKNEIADEIAKKYDFENEKEKLEKASKVADTLLGLFDANNDAEISPQEFLDKLNSIYAQLETTNKLTDDLKGLAEQVTDLKSYVDTKIGEVNGAINSLKTDISENAEKIKNLEANVKTNFFTKDDIKAMMTINKDEIVKEVEAIFYPTDDTQGDGATL